MITLTGCFYLVSILTTAVLVNGIMKSDHIKWMITLTGDNIKRISLYINCRSIHHGGDESARSSRPFEGQKNI
jgi:hypothetical protein